MLALQAPPPDAVAAAALESGRPGEARQTLEAQSPKSAYIWALLARTYFLLKQPAAALQAARQAEAHGAAQDPRAQHALALYHAQSGDRRKAARWEHAYALSPAADREAASRAAFLLAETGDAENAIVMGERATEKADRPELRSLLARLYENAGDPEKAIAHHRAALAARPYDEALRAEYGQALLRMARFQQALTALEEAQAAFDRSPQIVLALGVAYYAQRRYDDAAGRFLRVIDLDASIEQPYVFLSRMSDQLGPERLAALLPRFAAWNAREKTSPLAPLAYARLQPLAARKALLEESIRRKGDLWESHYELALVHEAARDLGAAARELETAVRLDGRQANAHYRLARVYDRLNRPADAARHRAIHAKLSAQDRSSGGGMTP